MSKRCPPCEHALPTEAFGRNKRLPDGLSFYCLSCNRARSNRWYRENRRRLGKEVRDHSWVPEGFRWCPTCQQPVAQEDYTRNSRTASGFGGSCKACKAAADSAGYFYRTYKLTQNEVHDLRTAQDNRCVICGEADPQHLDHDHQTGVTRQLLCQRCNQGLGLLRDDPAVLRAAADYVERHRQRPVAASSRPTDTPPRSSPRPAEPRLHPVAGDAGRPVEPPARGRGRHLST